MTDLLTCMVVHLDPVWVKCKGLGHRSKFSVTEGKCSFLAKLKVKLTKTSDCTLHAVMAIMWLKGRPELEIINK